MQANFEMPFNHGKQINLLTIVREVGCNVFIIWKSNFGHNLSHLRAVHTYMILADFTLIDVISVTKLALFCTFCQFCDNLFFQNKKVPAKTSIFY